MARKSFLFVFLVIAGCGGSPGPGPGEDGGPGTDAFVAHMDGSPGVDAYIPGVDAFVTPGCTADTQCDDHVDCTTDTCTSASGTCRHVPTPALCAAGESCDPVMGCRMGHACATDTDCADTDACTTMERCDPAARVCTFVTLDGDHDGDPPRVCGGGDCDDSHAAINPAAVETCDVVDNNCDGHVDETFNLMTDAMNCGRCGNACPTGSTCSMGVCDCTSAAETLCTSTVYPSYCINLAVNQFNCGSCGHHCPYIPGPGSMPCADDTDCTTAGTICSYESGSGVCIYSLCSGSSCHCPGSQMLCGTSCLDTSSDSNHCGDCTTVCSGGMTCTSGHCGCPAGQTSCGGTCIDTSSDMNNCGGCGIICESGSCVSGACHWSSCPSPGFMSCSGVSTCPFYDPLNCGSCGTHCDPGHHCVRSTCL